MSSSSEASSSSSRSSASPPPPKPKASKRKRSSEAPATTVDADSGDDSGNSDAEEEAVVVDSKPVLSHKEQRREKKRQKAAARAAAEAGDSDSEVPNKKRKLKDGTAAPAPVKRQNSVWVGNMSFKTTQANLQAFFSECGEITRIHLPMKASARPNLPQENRGFAYVDFATPEAKNLAISLSENPLIGRKLLIKDGGDFSGRPIAPGAETKTTDSALAQKTHTKTAQKILRNQKQPPAPTLFLGNLPFETTDDDIKQLFETHRIPKKEREAKEKAKDAAREAKNLKKKKAKDEDSESESEDSELEEEEEAAPETPDKQKKDDFILKIRMGTFEDSGACKGFAFVDFSSIDNATAALINPRNHRFNGRDLKVEYAGADAVRRGAAKHLLPGADKKDEKRGAGGGRGGRGGRGGGRGGARSGDRGPRSYGGDQEGNSGGYSRPSFDNEGEGEGEAAAPAQGGEEAAPERFADRGGDRGSRGGGRGGRGGRGDFKGARARPKPGAALALAKRETAAIVPSRGTKVTF